MRSDICVKAVASAQVAFYHALNRYARSSSSQVVRIAAACTAVADIVLDTLKYPGVVLENSCMTVVNVLGARCFHRCSWEDARASANLAKVAASVTLTAVGISILRLLIQISEAMTHPATVSPCNKKAEAESYFYWIVPADKLPPIPRAVVS